MDERVTRPIAATLCVAGRTFIFPLSQACYNALVIETIRELLNREPFVPFDIIITSGDRYHVIDPHLVALGESTVFYCYPRSDKWAWLRLNQITSIETTPRAA